jgi:hypothetical protein
MDEMRKACRVQTEAFKCLKERTKGAHSIVRRGLVTLAGTRQRQQRRLCTNLESDLTKQFVESNKCIMSNVAEKMRVNDMKLVLTHGEILKRNYNESAAELKQFCCSLHDYRKVSSTTRQGRTSLTATCR